MSLDLAFTEQVRVLFAPLKTNAGASPFPPLGTLSQVLEVHLSKLPKNAVSPSINLVPRDSSLFATAAVEMWQRAVHSYVISASLTDVSPVWASVSGYYSSHYSVRALAHLLGRFQLFKAGRITRVDLVGKKTVCAFESKGSNDREHKFYWRVVKQSAAFAADPLFTLNPSGAEPSDVAHRDRANYIDLIGNFPAFKPLDEAQLKERTNRISQITFIAPPIPRAGKYPDLVNVQVMAYHRLIKIRSILDEALGDSNRYWNGKRTPSWAQIISFQLAQQGGLASLSN